MIDSLRVAQLYSNEEIYRSLGVSNAGGIRPAIDRDRTVRRIALMTSPQGLHGSGENPYHDRLESGILTYTAEGRLGEQTLAGANARLAAQRAEGFPIHGFMLTASRRDKSVGAKRWRYLGLLQYLRHFADSQLDAAGNLRRVWVFEFLVSEDPAAVEIDLDRKALQDLIERSDGIWTPSREDYAVEPCASREIRHDPVQIEQVRSKLLALEPRAFELFIGDLLRHSGFEEICVTKASADGGIDVQATTGRLIWPFEKTLLQVQAKRWLRSVGRKEVAELRGSMRPFARGTIVTTGHFTRAAIREASEAGKAPVGLIDGPRLSEIVLDHKLRP